MPWKDKTYFESVEDLLIRFLRFWQRDRPIACRGQPDSNWPLQTSLDRILDPSADYVARLADELALLEKFRLLAHEHLGSNELIRLDQSLVNNKISALTVLQHYRAPTRLLDWTSSPWVALYFAAIEYHDKDGAIWWFDQQSFESQLDQRWENTYRMRRYPELNNGVNLNDTAFDSNGPPWITKLHCIVTFHRIEVQQAFFTVAGRLGLKHDDLIEEVLKDKDGSYGCMVIPALWKQEILSRLRQMNIHSKSLDYPGADLVGATLKEELRKCKSK